MNHQKINTMLAAVLFLSKFAYAQGPMELPEFTVHQYVAVETSVCSNASQSVNYQIQVARIITEHCNPRLAPADPQRCIQVPSNKPKTIREESLEFNDIEVFIRNDSNEALVKLAEKKPIVGILSGDIPPFDLVRQVFSAKLAYSEPVDPINAYVICETEYKNELYRSEPPFHPRS